MEPRRQIGPTGAVYLITPPAPVESDRIIDEYRRREKNVFASLYSMLRPANERTVHRLERALLRALRRGGVHDLGALRFLDVGCGTGGHILRWIQWGAQPERCSGVDLVRERLDAARHRLPSLVDLRVTDASTLPFADGAFDVTTQFTVFSSILDDAMQRAVAREMARVTRPGGLILSYDFWLNPTNPATCGVTVSRLRELFPTSTLWTQRITLAPPLARRVAAWSPILCGVLESLRLLNTHFLVLIQPPRP